MMGKLIYDRMNEEISDFASGTMPSYLERVQQRIKDATAPVAGSATMQERRLQSKRGAHNQGPGTKRKLYQTFGTFGRGANGEVG